MKVALIDLSASLMLTVKSSKKFLQNELKIQSLNLSSQIKQALLGKDINIYSRYIQKHKIALYADDILLFVPSPETSLPNVLAAFQVIG